MNLIKALLLLKLSLLILTVPNAAMALLPFQNTGNLYVSMWTSDEIAVFSPDGTPLERFTADGLDGPRGRVVLHSIRPTVKSGLPVSLVIAYLFSTTNISYYANSNTRILMNLWG